MLKKNHTYLQDYEEQTHDAIEVLRKLRLCHEKSQKREEELRSRLEEARKDAEKKQRALLETLGILERVELKNKGL